MSLRLADQWMWDFWFARQGEFTHIFYLQAPRDLGDANLRHRHASIGHARSHDLRNWEVLPDTLQPSNDENDWDGLATWTGSVIEQNGRWHLFYTGISACEEGQVERIGMASSDDLFTWHKHADNPLISIDAQHYEVLDKRIWYEETWRDPWVFAWQGSYHALITARGKDGEVNGRGVIAHAVSQDLRSWQVLEPLEIEAEFAYLEVPQVVRIGQLWYLFFSVEKERYALQRTLRPGVQAQTGTHYLVSEDPLGPYRMLTDDFLLGDAAGSYYAGKAIRDRQGNWVLLACRQNSAEGAFIGELSDPMPLQVLPDGRLKIEKEHEYGG
ncbi:MAG: beta-fructofuranosidase [Chloroflexota bacterium]|nr:beta-fructofuranosidase [Chloroflexota bacterium]